MANQVALRLGFTGDKEIKAGLSNIEKAGTQSFDKVGDASERAAARAQKAFDTASREIMTAQERQSAAAEKLAAFSVRTPMQAQIESAVGSNSGLSARDSAAVFRALSVETDRSSVALVRNAGATKSTQFAMRDLSFQLSDIATGFATGQSAAIIFAQQSGQVIGAFQMMSGEGNGFLKFLTGPWGLAFTSALVVITPFVAKLFEQGEASKEAEKEAKKHAAAIQSLIDAQQSAIRTEEQKLRMDAVSLESGRKRRDDILKTTEALLKQALAQRAAFASANDNARNSGEIGSGAIGALSTNPRVAELQKQLKDAQAALAEAAQATKIARNRAISQGVDEASTPQGRATQAYNLARNKLIETGGDDVGVALTKLRVAYDAQIKAIQESERAHRKHKEAVDKDTLTADAVAKLLRDVIPGVKITSLTRSKARNAAVGGAENSYHVSGNAVDFVPPGGMNSMTKEDVKRLFTSRGIDVLEVLGPGDKGHSDHFHVAWTKGKLALDDFVAAAKAAKAEQEDLKNLLGLFDPAGEAAAAYADQLERIDKLLKSGAITDTQKGILYRAAGLTKFDKDAAPPPNADETLRSVGINMDSPLFSDAQINKQNSELAKTLGILPDKIAPVIDALTVMQAAGRDAIDAITDPANWNNLGDIAHTIINSIISDLAKLAIANPLKNLLFGGDSSGNPFSVLGGGGLFGSGGGIFKSLFGGSGGGTTSLFGGLGLDSGFAVGTEYAPGGMALVGEHGAELVNLPRGSRVNTADQTKRMLRGGNDNGGVTVSMPITLNAQGAGPREVDELKAEIARLRRDFPTIAVGAVADARQRRIGG